LPAKLTRGPYRYCFRSSAGVEGPTSRKRRFFRSIWKSTHLDKPIALAALGMNGRIETPRGDYRREEVRNG
jgi:hypothetical protein